MARAELFIVYDGPLIVGKTSSARYVRAQLRGVSTERRPCITPGRDVGYQEFDFGTADIAITVAWESSAAFQPPVREALRRRADGLVFVFDSQRERFLANEESADNLDAVLREVGPKPLVVQFNKRDLPNAAPLAEMSALNRWRTLEFESIASRGIGVWAAFEAIVLAAARIRYCEAAAQALLAWGRAR